jgi:prolyl aminopeptidase
METWIEELQALRCHLNLDRIHILGQSWGGMMVIAYLIDHCPEGIQSAILSSTLSSSELWSHEQHRLISFMPEHEQAAIAEAERTGNWESAEYLAANDHYTVRHACDLSGDRPECLTRKKRFGTESYLTAWGPNEYTPLGNLRSFDYTARLHEIKEPCLIINGTNDECTPLLAKTMFDAIPNARWELLDGARHMTFVDNTAQYCQILNNWMSIND